MAETTPNLGLNVWNLVSDFFNHAELEENWEELDAAVLDKRGDVATGPITFQGLNPTSVVARARVSGDTDYRLIIEADGTIGIGGGVGASYLKINRVTLPDLHGLDGHGFQFDGIVTLRANNWLETNQDDGPVFRNYREAVDTQWAFEIDAEGWYTWRTPGHSGTTMSHDTDTVTFTNTGEGGAFVKATGFEATRVSIQPAFQNFLVDGHANPTIRIRGDGKVQWGAGGASATDVSLARSASNQLTLENNGTFIAGTITASNAMSVGGVSVARDGQGLLSGRPAAATIGRYYYATDEGVLYRDTGSAWIVVSRTFSDIPWAKVYRDFTNFSVPSGGVGTQIEFNQVAPTRGSNAPSFNLGAAPESLLINQDGMYYISGTVWWATTNSIGRRLFQLTKGSGVTLAGAESPGSTVGVMQTISAMVYLEDGERVATRVYQNSGVSLDLLNSETYAPSLTVARVGS
jgi:hypothetical protein